MALLVIELTWFGYIARLSRRGGILVASGDYYLPSRRLEAGKTENNDLFLICKSNALVGQIGIVHAILKKSCFIILLF
jgi:hypothetical protein